MLVEIRKQNVSKLGQLCHCQARQQRFDGTSISACDGVGICRFCGLSLPETKKGRLHELQHAPKGNHGLPTFHSERTVVIYARSERPYSLYPGRPHRKRM